MCTLIHMYVPLHLCTLNHLCASAIASTYLWCWITYVLQHTCINWLTCRGWNRTIHNTPTYVLLAVWEGCVVVHLSTELSSYLDCLAQLSETNNMATHFLSFIPYLPGLTEHYQVAEPVCHLKHKRVSSYSNEKIRFLCSWIYLSRNFLLFFSVYISHGLLQRTEFPGSIIIII